MDTPLRYFGKQRARKNWGELKRRGGGGREGRKGEPARKACVFGWPPPCHDKLPRMNELSTLRLSSNQRNVRLKWSSVNSHGTSLRSENGSHHHRPTISGPPPPQAPWGNGDQPPQAPWPTTCIYSWNAKYNLRVPISGPWGLALGTMSGPKVPYQDPEQWKFWQLLLDTVSELT